VIVVIVGVVLRFWARSDLWLDEALTVNISRLPLGSIHGALREDGAPPLYYVALHFWMEIFGTSNLAVRALSGVFSCVTLPFIWVAGRRMGGRTVAACAVVLVASSPFAVLYATENRMYSLVGLLSVLGIVGLQRVFDRPTAWNLIGVGAVAALLLYSHYWALYLVGTTTLWLAWQAWRGPARHRRPARLALAAVVVGCLTFIPWLPTFIFQTRHTGTPWAIPADFAAMVNAVTSFAGGATNQGRALALLYFALAGLGLFGVARGAYHVDLDLRTRRAGRPVAIALGGTLAAAVVGGFITRSAFQARYASVVFVPLVLLVALGFATLSDRRIRMGVLAATLACGLAGSVTNIWTSRTQAGQVATALARFGRPGDIVAFCPDQLGPSVARVLPPQRYRMTTFPRGTAPQFVDWINYSAATHAGNPVTFVQHLEKMAGPDHQIFLAWAPDYQTYGIKCQEIEAQLAATPGLQATQLVAYRLVTSDVGSFEDMSLVRYVHVPG
jgi:hypothetical protein